MGLKYLTTRCFSFFIFKMGILSVQYMITVTTSTSTFTCYMILIIMKVAKYGKREQGSRVLKPWIGKQTDKQSKDWREIQKRKTSQKAWWGDSYSRNSKSFCRGTHYGQVQGHEVRSCWRGRGEIDNKKFCVMLRIMTFILKSAGCCGKTLREAET